MDIITYLPGNVTRINIPELARRTGKNEVDLAKAIIQLLIIGHYSGKRV